MATTMARPSYRATVTPELSLNLYLDHTLRLRRGPDGVELEPKEGMGSGDGYIHFSIITTVGEEAAYWVIGSDHVAPACVSVQLLRPARIDGGLITGVGCLLRAGKHVIVAEGTVMQDMKLLAKVSVTFVHFIKELR